jgi:hypothetical protein
MADSPAVDEVGLVGNWIWDSGRMHRDAVCERIQSLVEQQLNK